MERVLFVLTLLLVICVLAVSSALVLVIFRARAGKQTDKNATTTPIPTLNTFLSSTISSSIQLNATRITGQTGATHYTAKSGSTSNSVNINSQPTATLETTNSRIITNYVSSTHGVSKPISHNTKISSFFNSTVSLSKTSRYIPTPVSKKNINNLTSASSSAAAAALPTRFTSPKTLILTEKKTNIQTTTGMGRTSQSTYTTKIGKSIQTDIPVKISTIATTTTSTTTPTTQSDTTKLQLNSNATTTQVNTTVQSTIQPTTKQSNAQLCQTKGCVIAAARILQAMNMSVEPCTNFYQYACGDWIDTHPVEPYSAEDIFREDIKLEKIRIIELLKAKINRNDIDAVKKTKLAYESCTGIYYIKEKSFMNVKYLVQKLGGLPLLSKGWKANQSLINYLVNARTKFGVMPLLPIFVEIDQKNTSRNIIYLGAGSETTGKSIISDVSYFAHIRDPVYDQLLTKVLKQFDVNRSDVKAQIDELSFFVKYLGIARWQSRVNIDDVASTYHQTTLGEITSNYTWFDWKAFLQSLLGMNESNTYLSNAEPIIVVSPKYISAMMSLMNKTNIRTLQNYIVLSTIMYYKSSLGIDYRATTYTSSTVTKNKYAMNSEKRTEDCYNIFTEDFKHVLGWMYVQRYFTKDRKESINEVTTITNYIINAVHKLLQSNKWLGEKSKMKSLEKIEQLVKIIGFNAKTMIAQNVNELFQGMTITANNFFQNLIQIKSKRLKLSFIQLREKPSRKGDDGDGIFAVNAWYDSEMNSITVPAGILRNPFFNIHSPMSLNFGGLGTILGHELIHAFDNDGTLYNAEGEYSPWLTPSAKTSFERFSKDLIKEYSHFKIPGTNLYVNGQLTLDENIADNGGIQVAYNAFLKWKSSQNVHYKLPGLALAPDQLFFLTFAQNWCAHFSPIAMQNQVRYDPHAPDMARVLLTLRNSKEFAAAYNCHSGSYMNPTTKYGVW